ncbi:insulin receptor-like [Oratosquilla oratoria]|uniref:insulin receptor-like n=1 Tax=Oratosquilla oratoria TaxID=337810 RepID=UPI003F760684
MVLVIFVILSSFLIPAWASDQHDSSCGERPSPHRDKIICGSIDVRNNAAALKKLCHCDVIEGHLHFVLLDWKSNQFNNFSFPNLREVTHHVLVYSVFHLTTLRGLFPNLAVIRGKVVFHNYALVIYEVPDLTEVGLVSLTSILRGFVRIEKNSQLCFVKTVAWEAITTGDREDNYVKRNRAEGCHRCPETLGCPSLRPGGRRLCWSEDQCQTLCSRDCPGGCLRGRCCHAECLGGCTDPESPSACHACRNFFDGTRCVSNCPGDKFKLDGHHCVSASVCLQRNKFLREESRECLDECPAGTRRSTRLLQQKEYRVCVTCGPGVRCPKVCVADEVKSISRAQNLRGCTIISGSLTVSITGGENVMRELEDSLQDIEEVEGFVKIFRSNVTSLKFLKSLRKIGGDEHEYGNYSLVVVDNPNLETLWTEKKRLQIVLGKLFFHFNPRLCLHHIRKLIKAANMTNLSETDVASASNGDKVTCTVNHLNVSVQSSPMFGTLVVHVSLHGTTRHLSNATGYYIHYKIAPNNVSLFSNKNPCDDDEMLYYSLIIGTIVKENAKTMNNLFVKVFGTA